MVRTSKEVSKTSFAIFKILIRVGVTAEENISSFSTCLALAHKVWSPSFQNH